MAARCGLNQNWEKELRFSLRCKKKIAYRQALYTIKKKNMKDIQYVEFANSINSNAQFDFVKLETIFHKKYKDHSVEKPHKVGFFVIFLIEEGKGCHTIDFIDYECSKGTLLTIRKDQIHKFSKNDSLRGSLLVHCKVNYVCLFSLFL